MLPKLPVLSFLAGQLTVIIFHMPARWAAGCLGAGTMAFWLSTDLLCPAESLACKKYSKYLRNDLLEGCGPYLPGLLTFPPSPRAACWQTLKAGAGPSPGGHGAGLRRAGLESGLQPVFMWSWGSCLHGWAFLPAS